MPKITELTKNEFTAKIFRSVATGEYRVRYYRNNKIVPHADAFESDEESARGTANCDLDYMVEAEAKAYKNMREDAALALEAWYNDTTVYCHACGREV